MSITDPRVGLMCVSPDEMQRLRRLEYKYERLQEQQQSLKLLISKGEMRRRAFIHILHDLNMLNKQLSSQRKAMIHILADYEQDRRRLAQQTESLDNSRCALLHILQDSHHSNLRLEKSRKAMIHIMSDLKETTEEVKCREQELREKQKQLVQAGKLATLGELTTGVAHELNNPLNCIGLFIGNAIDLIELGQADLEWQQVLRELQNAMQQINKATSIISQLRTFGRVASAHYEPVRVKQAVQGALMLMEEQLHLRQIEVDLNFPSEEVLVLGSAIQLEQIFLNLLTNARDAMASTEHKCITISCTLIESIVEIRVSDTGIGIPVELEQRIFDPFFTTKEVGKGTGLGLSITYGIIKEHQGTITVENHPGKGAIFRIQLPSTKPR